MTVTDRARTEAADRYAAERHPGTGGYPAETYYAFVAGAEWAAGQDPTDAEVTAAMVAYEGHPDRVSAWRAALTAARDARRAEG